MQQSNFDRFSSEWWDPQGPAGQLHSMNKTRMLFIQERLLNRYENFRSIEDILSKKKILDLGCGGGILSEHLAKKGANITAIDSSKPLIDLAKKRAINQNLKINYKLGTIDSLKKNNSKFDVIISLEVIEHVKNYETFLRNIFLCLENGGIVILSTINRTTFSYLSTIIIAEKILRIVPKGTHDWSKYIKPAEIIRFAKKHNFKIDKKCGLFPIPSNKNFNWIRVNNVSSNYILSLVN